VALGQTQDDDAVALSVTLPRADKVVRDGDARLNNDLDSFLQRLDQQSWQIEQLQQENRRLSDGLERLGKAPATGVSYRLENGPGTGGEALGNLDCKVGVLWDAMPIWQPCVEGSFRGGGITERGELDVFMPLMWSDNVLLFADLRGRFKIPVTNTCGPQTSAFQYVPIIKGTEADYQIAVWNGMLR